MTNELTNEQKLEAETLSLNGQIQGYDNVIRKLEFKIDRVSELIQPLIDFELRACPICGVNYLVTHEFIYDKKESQDTFYCPNGHPRYFPRVTKEEKLQKELSQVNQDYEECRVNLQSQILEREDKIVELTKSRSSLKGQVTKLKKKIEN